MAPGWTPELLDAFGYTSSDSVRFVKYLHVDGTIVTDRWLGLGASGLVVEQGPYAVKLPVLSRDAEEDEDGVPLKVYSLTPKKGEYDDRAIAVEHIQTEKANHMTTRQPQWDPTRQMQLSWFTKLAHTLVYVHERRVIVSDIRLDNFLLDESLAIRFCDFGNAEAMPLDWDLEGSDKYGYSISSDLGQFGAVMYEVITGRKCAYDLVWLGCGIPGYPHDGKICQQPKMSGWELAAALDKAAEILEVETGAESPKETQETSVNGNCSSESVDLPSISPQPETDLQKETREQSTNDNYSSEVIDLASISSQPKTDLPKETQEQSVNDSHLSEPVCLLPTPSKPWIVGDNTPALAT
ncbi:hypothetical protein AYL99_09806 [Fonsecaea erecta]|uniref:Protein kinase domain-containing protein n=1 Tax=Fonsecaea erecta TaxID=1367422 RepID=A0A178Z7A3_9EURO|nr:hypothetical protein AYL99_09806 [Fonsecaea erecta]OAP55654.1 hypothetical protein AYL99_09806 [Fonsecaea erecta]